MSTAEPKPTPRPRTRFQFNLATLMWVMLVLGIVLAWWRDRREFDQRLSRIENMFRPQQSGWGIDQVLGPPNTTGPGDISSAWASATPDGQIEWLLLTYEKAIVPASVEIHETYNPGAVFKVCFIDGWGAETVVWQGVDPTPTTAGAGTSSIPLKTTRKTNKVKIYLDSPKVSGWNEIDAVGLKDAAGKIIWAKSADASSSFGQAYGTTYGYSRF